MIYIADDDKNVCQLLKSQLLSENYLVETFYDANSLLSKFLQNSCDLVITDIMMPKISGYELCKEIRKISDIPIIMISAKDEEIDRILGLELGSDDYISKPFSLREISIKVRNMLHRVNNNFLCNTDNRLFCKDVEIIKSNRVVLIHGEEFITTVKEYDLLELLIANKNQAFSREKIIKKVWGYDYFGDTRQVDHLIKRLRKKMLLAEIECKIETIWGYGYKVSD
ncbi:response regulator transcription factor [Sedimentibacter sp. zth1]|uniref:response regulator transcription factor n=1 Tax=Sedimentibacter sp. zth1 TaxID=2816908 RepID=UPI001F5F904C|nr:response regulator transcription factor [Sedimentibacter sp. zth1]